MKKIVVTGATSMLGVATIEECLQNDIEVIAFAHRNSKNIYRLPHSPKLQIIEVNLDEFANYTPNINDADVFYHFAWAATTHEGRVNVDVQEERRPLLIQTSAGAVQPFQGFRYDHRIHLIAFLHTSNVIRAAPIGIAVAFQIGELRALVQDARVAQMPLAL